MTIHLIILYATLVTMAFAFLSVFAVGYVIGGSAKKSAGEGVDAMITIGVLAIVIEAVVCIAQFVIRAVGA